MAIFIERTFKGNTYDDNGKTINIDESLKEFFDKYDQSPPIFSVTGEKAGCAIKYNENGFEVNLTRRVDSQAMLRDNCYKIQMTGLVDEKTNKLHIEYLTLVFDEGYYGTDELSTKTIRVKVIEDGIGNARDSIDKYISENGLVYLLTEKPENQKVVGRAIGYDGEYIAINLNPFGTNVYNDAVAVGAEVNFFASADCNVIKGNVFVSKINLAFLNITEDKLS